MVVDPFENRYHPAEVRPALPAGGIVDIARYSRSVYLLTSEGSIWKYTPDSANRVYTGKPWLKKGEEPAKNPRGITIDGAVYILEGNNVITRYFSGAREESVALPQEIPSISQIITKEDFSLIYAASPESLGILEITKKDGSIEKAYTHEIFSAIRAFSLTPDGKSITFTTQEGAYLFPLP